MDTPSSPPTEAEELAREWSKPGKFQLMQRLSGGGLPEVDVTIYLAEDLAHAGVRDNLEGIRASAVTLTLRAIPADEHRRMLGKRWGEWKLSRKLLERSIVRATDSRGRVDDLITPYWVRQFLGYAPVDAARVVFEKIQMLTSASYIMDEIQNEDFLAQALIWDDHSWIVPRIRAALEAGVPPVAMLLRDPAHKEYDAWDMKLASAHHIRETMLVGSVPIYWDQSDRVAFDVKKGKSKSRAKIQAAERAAQKKAKNNESELDGLYFYTVPRTIDGGPLPTYEEWAEEKRRLEGK